MNMNIRKTRMEELEVLLALYAHARSFMAEHGNETQWGSTYPPRELVEEDILSGHSYVCERDGRIAATFFYSEEPDACYQHIENGQWLNENPYGVIHRIASDGQSRGTATYCLSWALAQCKNVRIDTHRDNVIMQHLLEKNGFRYCGIVHMKDGTERMAYQNCLAEPAV